MGACSASCLPDVRPSKWMGKAGPPQDCLGSENFQGLQGCSGSYATLLVQSPQKHVISSRTSQASAGSLVAVISMTGAHIAKLPLYANETVAELKVRIENIEGTQAKSQRLIQAGRLLSDVDEVQSREPVMLFRMQRKMAISTGSQKTPADTYAIRLRDLETGEQLQMLQTAIHVSSLAVDWDNLRCFSGSADGTIRVWDLASDRCVHVLSGHPCWICGLCPDYETRLASICQEGVLKLWDLREGLQQLSVQTSKGKHMQMSVNWPHMLAMVASGFSATVYNLLTGNTCHTLATSLRLVGFDWHEHRTAGRALFICPLDFSSNERQRQGMLQLWTVEAARPEDLMPVEADGGSSQVQEFGQDCALAASADWSSERVVVAIGRPTRYFSAAGSFRRLSADGLQVWSLSTLTLLYSLGDRSFEPPMTLNVNWESARCRAITSHEDVGGSTRFVFWDFEAGIVKIINESRSRWNAVRHVSAVVTKP